jgi:hypothetical protein
MKNNRMAMGTDKGAGNGFANTPFEFDLLAGLLKIGFVIPYFAVFSIVFIPFVQ